MGRLEQSIEVNVPLNAAYRQLSQFEEFPRFMKGVHSVHQLDPSHLHWRAEKGGKEMEWDAEIVEQIPDQCIAWRNISGPRSEGKVVLEALGPAKTRISLSMEAEDAAMKHQDDGSLAPQEDDDLARFKKMMETQGHEAGTQRSSRRVERVSAWKPPVEMTQQAGQLRIRADLPGVARQDVQVEVARGRLIIEGERRRGAGFESCAGQAAVQALPEPEFQYGHFYRELVLAEDIDPGSVHAVLRDGVLEINFRTTGARPGGRRVDIHG